MVLDKDKDDFRKSIKEVDEIIERYLDHLHNLRRDEPLFGKKPYKKSYNDAKSARKLLNEVKKLVGE